MEWNELPGLFPHFPEPARWLPLLQRHAALLQENDSHTRVTAVAPLDAIRRQYAESHEIWRIATAHLVHLGGPHLLLDLLGLILICELLWGDLPLRHGIGLLCFSAVAVSASR